VTSICEFTAKKLLVYAKRSGLLLIFHDWKVIHEISDSDAGNTYKDWQSPFPGFHVDSFPFVITSGLEFYGLLNLNSGVLQKMIKATSRNYYAMQPFFMMKDANG